MKLQSFILAICLLSAVSVVKGQDSTLVPPQPSVPQEQNPAPANGEPKSEQKEDRMEVKKEMLPPLLLEALKEEKYSGWEDSPIYYEKNTDQYILHVTKDNSTQTFRFDKEGEPITTDKPMETQEKRQ